MSDPVAAAPQGLGPFEIHPKVAVYTLVIVAVNTILATAKAHGWFDATADAATLGASLGALAAYFTSGA